LGLESMDEFCLSFGGWGLFEFWLLGVLGFVCGGRGAWWWW